MVVVHGPEGGQVLRLHGQEEVLPPAALQAHEARQALLGVRAHHLQAVRHVGLVKNPSEEKAGSEKRPVLAARTVSEPRWEPAPSRSESRGGQSFSLKGHAGFEWAGQLEQEANAPQGGLKVS